MRIPKRHDAKTDDHRNDCIATLAAPVHGLDRVEHVLRCRIPVHARLQLMREYIEQHLGIGVGREMAAIFADQQVSQFVVIGQVAVMREADSVR